MKTWHIFFAGAAVVGIMAILPQSAAADAINDGPPVGAILDLAGNPISSSYVNYSVTFIASNTDTDLTFALRDDPAYLYLDDISMVDNAASSGNLVLNGGFETGDLTDWTYDNIYGASAGGTVLRSNPYDGSYDYYDGAVQAYDAIDQNIATTVGDSYTISFYLNGGGNGSTYQDLSTNGDITGTGGNGIDLLVYAQGGLPQASAPEPASFLLFGAGLAGIAVRYRRGRRQR